MPFCKRYLSPDVSCCENRLAYSLDNLHADLLRLAQQGTPDTRDQLYDVIELRARISGDMKTLAEQQEQISNLAKKS